MVLTLEYFMYFMYNLVCEQMCHVMINLFISLTNICKMIIGYASPHLLNATAEKTCYINHMEEWREGGSIPDICHERCERRACKIFG